MYNKIEEAIHFMVKANKGQKRKNENIDKSFHSTEYGYEEIEEKFGTLVADIVADLSEDMAITKWLNRKKDYVRRMRANNDINVINIMLADKLHNLLSNYDNYLKLGDKMWKNTGGSKEENCWLYRECYLIAKSKNAYEGLLNRYKEIIKIYFGGIDE